MADERWEDEGHGTLPVRLVRDAVPTSRHAEMLFRMVVDHLGADGHVETADGGKRRVLFRRARADASSYVPWPLLSLGIGGRLSHTIMIEGPEGQPAPPARGPRVRGAGSGEVTVHDGPDAVTVTYGDDGRWFETSRSGSVRALAGVVAALERRSAQPVELVAEFLAKLDVERAGPGTVFLPVPLPLRVAWVRGLHAIRHALFYERVPDDAPWVAADGYDGIALAWGATRADALTRWRAEVERLRPAPPQPPPGPAEPPPGFVRLTAPRADGARPEPAPDNTPAAIVRLAPPPRAAPPFGQWTRLLGPFGTTTPAALRRDVAGFTLVGDRLAAALGPDGLARLDESLDAAAPLPRAAQPQHNCLVSMYRLVDEATGEPGPAAVVEAVECEEFNPRMLDGEVMRWRVLRQRWLDLEPGP